MKGTISIQSFESILVQRQLLQESGINPRLGNEWMTHFEELFTNGKELKVRLNSRTKITNIWGSMKRTKKIWYKWKWFVKSNWVWKWSDQIRLNYSFLIWHWNIYFVLVVVFSTSAKKLAMNFSIENVMLIGIKCL